TKNWNLTANFPINTYTLNVVTSGGTGTITKSPDQATYDHFTPVTVTATPAAGFAFISWSGDTTTTASSLSIVMKKNWNLTANFTPATLPFAQTFSFSSNLTDYQLLGTSVGSQDSARWDAFAVTGSSTVTISGGRLVLNRASSSAASFTRFTDIANPPPGTL